METIAAIATARGVAAGVGILRVSGDCAEQICQRVFRADNGRPLTDQRARTLLCGSLLDSGEHLLDRILAVVFRGGHSYTGETVVELQCHGSPVVLEEGLNALLAAGARMAQPGEFTKRAFLNGCMDLTQAEAVIDLIDADSAEAARNAAGQIDGAVLRPAAEAYDALMDVTARFYAIVDYPDEDIEPLQLAQIDAALERSESLLDALAQTVDRGRILRRGVPTALLGKPNVGKSSLLNALVGYERAIVTTVAGTTRDTVEEKVRLGGVLLRLTDTAGIRDTADAVERIGVDRALGAAKEASLALLVLDGSAPLTEEDAQAMAAAEAAEHTIVLLNKTDLPCVLTEDMLPKKRDAVCAVSAATGAGLDDLAAAVAAVYPMGDAPAGTFLTNARQSDAVRRALTAVRRAKDALRAQITPDAVLTDAEEAMSALGELTGKTLREDLVDTIFSRFCVGK